MVVMWVVLLVVVVVVGGIAAAAVLRLSLIHISSRKMATKFVTRGTRAGLTRSKG